MSRCQCPRLLPLLIAVVSPFLLLGGAMRLNGQQVKASVVKQAEQNGGTDAYWLQAKQEVDKSSLEILAQHNTEKAHGLRYNKIIHGNRQKKWVALTFDDGPHPQFTPKLLALLRQEQVKATFFVVGEMAEKYPDLVRAELAQGHAVGNHTYHHVNLTKILPRDVATEVVACGDVLQKITGQRPHLFRPPGGDYDKGVIETTDALGYTTVLWTDDPGDYASPGQQLIAKRVLAHVNNGGIILIHDGIEQTFAVLPEIITTLKKEGYTFVTVDEMLHYHQPELTKPLKFPLVHHGAPAR